MAWLKYFDKIIAAQTDARSPSGPLPPFDFDSLGSGRVAQAIVRYGLRHILPLLMAGLRIIRPNLRLGRLVLVTRRLDIEEVLGDTARFHVPYGLEMKELGKGENNVLGMDGERHDRLLDSLHRAMPAADIDRIGQWVSEDAAALIETAGGRIDVMRDLVTRTATEASARYFGITVDDPDVFAEWTMAVSNLLFGDFFGDRNIRQQAEIGAAHLRTAIDDGIAQVHSKNSLNNSITLETTTLIDRLITDIGMEDEKVRATILGLVTAFMPTNTLAAGNILEVLFTQPLLMRRAKEAAVSANRDLLRKTILEAARLNPALSPGLWRHLPEDASPTVIAEGTRRERELRAGDIVLACIPSGLRDTRKVDKSELPDAWLMFGYGPHVCLGAELALAHLVSVFERLLACDNLVCAKGKHGKMTRTGPYPTRLDMTYSSPASRRSLMIIALPVRKGLARCDVEAMLNALGNPAIAQVKADLDATDRVQFASISVIEREPTSADSILVLEISGDGDDDELLELISEHCYGWLAPLVNCCSREDAQTSTPKDLALLLKQGHRKLSRWPWGTTGLNFDGLGELSVDEIARQQGVAQFARKTVDLFTETDLGLSTRAMDILVRTRRLIQRHPLHVFLSQTSALIDDHAPPSTAVLKPSRKRLAIADWVPPASNFEAMRKLLSTRDGWPVVGAALFLFVACTAPILIWLGPGGDELAPRLTAILLSAVAGVVLASMTAVTISGVFLLLVRRAESREVYDPRAVRLDELKKVSLREDHPGYVQNHILAVMPFKRGLLRRFSFALSMWGIKQAVTHWFRPGFVVTMGTIHKARWFRLPNTNQFVFLSNYDGSWESYLEDFVTRANEGQSAAWGHGEGFPPTRFLVLDGAEHGDRFKRWVRLQQQPSLFWYSRFPNLTAQQIRRNAMIEDGLARAVTDTDARRWLANFGSAQREVDELETQEAQTILFSGFGRQTHATALFLRTPTNPEGVAGWLKAVTGLKTPQLNGVHGTPPADWLSDDRIEVPLDARVRFGEQSPDSGGSSLGLTATGLGNAGLTDACGLNSFPAPFRISMAKRGAKLGDGNHQHSSWRFTDDYKQPDGVDAVLVVYGHEPNGTHAELVSNHLQLLHHFGGSSIHEVPCAPVEENAEEVILDREHFGFRDGVSQPVMSGTRRAGRHVPERDLVPAGEFLLGYRNMQGFISPPIEIGAEYDARNDLPTISATSSNRYPYFGNRTPESATRDFGRNGSFLAVRQLDQDVEGFRTATAVLAKHLNESYPGLRELAGGIVDDEWVAAKIVGRWRDGSPLVGHTDGPGSIRANELPENDFAYGIDDPRGFACPLGAHIRRANPRDSLEPGDDQEQKITNRHRLLRRGRSYAYKPDGQNTDECKGLLFMALCSDLERQFEFVQRTWLNATSFHGLVNERDPLLGGPRGAVEEVEPAGQLTIPTPAGPVTIPDIQSSVQLRGGGYFFIPSRSAFAFLIRKSQQTS